MVSMLMDNSMVQEMFREEEKAVTGRRDGCGLIVPGSEVADRQPVQGWRKDN